MDNEQAMQLILQKLDTIQADVNDIKTDVSELKQDVSALKDDVSEIKEDAAITRTTTNKLFAWAERAQVQIRVPVFDKAE